jgi:alkylation response protein AidB-like acyl-CoA dehydrogenase
VERFVVIEELLAAGAPVGAHWIADRQTAPTLLAFGTEAQRRRFLPAICAGRCFFSIGMSEPDAGSDLAAVGTTARRVEEGWVLNGTKIWTSHAHRNHFFCVLCRTGPRSGDRHEGLSQLIVDLRSPGLAVRPIQALDGSHHFNEVVLDEVFVPDDLVLGDIGDGWHQVTSELAHERGGPDRFLSAYQLLEHYLREWPATDPVGTEEVGRLVARFWMIRQLSLSVARAVDLGRSPAAEAAMVKDLGTAFEQDTVATIQRLVDTEVDPGATSVLAQLLARSVLLSPSYTIRGGTSEVLRGLAARALCRP